MRIPFDARSAAPIRLQGESDTACLLLHGLTGAPGRDMWFLAEFLHAQGISVYAPLLTGHGATWEELRHATAPDWQNDAVRSLEEVSTGARHVFVLGLSMGGVLALYLAEHVPAVDGVITINTPMVIDDWRLRLVPLVRHVRARQPKAPPDVADTTIELPDLGYNPLDAVYQFLMLIRTVRHDLGLVTQPLLSFRSTQDHVVPPRNAEVIARSVNSRYKSIVTLDRSYHVATIDFDRQKIAALTYQFMMMVRDKQI
jgi:carboxylesterase